MFSHLHFRTVLAFHVSRILVVGVSCALRIFAFKKSTHLICVGKCNVYSCIQGNCSIALTSRLPFYEIVP